MGYDKVHIWEIQVYLELIDFIIFWTLKRHVGLL